MDLTEFNNLINGNSETTATTIPKKLKVYLKSHGIRIKDCCIEGARIKILEKTTNIVSLHNEITKINMKIEAISKKLSITTMEVYDLRDKVLKNEH